MNSATSSIFDSAGEFDCCRNGFNQKSAASVRPRVGAGKAQVVENENKEPLRESEDVGFVFEANLRGDMKKLVSEKFGFAFWC
ncbi:hypothetical protein F3Y22_tig00112402pilonHSYRG00323 [Hibiscus syriacus]|uniref:Uncharacterized protein n=1 Tax=Hibiscus syriacus TaxID=106335 RepID=A0A6A2XYI1_HIBSY|nr:hypothetical protein F3Y22_tig00112402pilonHSYRG00323 [Hibiscus syriacus]